MTNSLDARAIAAPGGIGSGLVDAVSAIVDGLVKSRDRQGERDVKMALIEGGEKRQDKRIADANARHDKDTRLQLLINAATKGVAVDGADQDPVIQNILAGLTTAGAEDRAGAKEARDSRLASDRAARTAHLASAIGTAAPQVSKAVTDVLGVIGLGGGTGAGKGGGKLGGDGLAPDELTWRQMMADRELDGLGVTIYQPGDLGGKPTRMLAPGKTWADAMPIYRRWNLPVPNDAQAPTAAPVGAPNPGTAAPVGASPQPGVSALPPQRPSTPSVPTPGFWTLRRSGQGPGFATLGDTLLSVTGQMNEADGGSSVQRQQALAQVAGAKRSELAAIADPATRRAMLAEIAATNPDLYNAMKMGTF